MKRALLGAALALALIPAIAQAAGPPVIKSTSFSQVTATSATLEAEVDPNGKATRYRFEYGLVDCATGPCISVPPVGSKEPQVPSAAGPTILSAPIEALAPATSYHFRILATHTGEENGEVAAPDNTLRTYAEEPTFGPCPDNEAFRTGPSAKLPDCRAYEQVSTEKNAADIGGEANKVQAATDGSAITYFSPAGLPGGVGAQDFQTYLASRGSRAWTTAGVYPPASYGPIARNAGWSPDLSLFFSDSAQGFNDPWALNLRDSATGSFSTVAENGPAGEETLAAAAAGGNLIFFEAEAQLTPETAPGTTNLYVFNRATGKTQLVGVLPNAACGVPPCVSTTGSLGGPYDWIGSRETRFGGAIGGYYVGDEHAVSADGARAYFTDRSDGQLYLREDASGPEPKTILVSASERPTPDPLGNRPAAFLGATPDGSKAFFTSPEKLTNDANTGPEQKAPSIARANLSDGSGKDLEFLAAHANSLATGGGYLYWASQEEGRIGRAKLDSNGSDLQTDPDFIVAAGAPHDLSVQGEHLFWTNTVGEGSIGRAKVGLGPAEEVDDKFIEGAPVDRPLGIASDPKYVYWANGGVGSGATAGAVGRASLDGTEAEREFIPEIASGDLAVSSTRIYRSRSNGSDGFLLVSRLDGTEVARAIIAPGSEQQPDLTVAGSYIYWTNPTNGYVGRARLDSEGELEDTEPTFITGGDHPEGLAAESEHLYWNANQHLVPNPGNDLYRFDALAPEGHRLTDLTPDPTDTNGAEVQGMLGTSDDGSYVYFAANGDLDGTGQATSGSCQAKLSGEGGLSASGTCGLYLSHNGLIGYLAQLNAATDAPNWLPTGDNSGEPPRSGFVSADGHALLYRSGSSLYRYNTETGIACVSCNPSGASSQVATMRSIKRHGPIAAPGGNQAFSTRNLSADGNRAFFETPDKLVGSDTNEVQDVYEWEAPDSGSCAESSSAYSPPNQGCLYLLSAGTGAEASFFGDASVSGDDVFIFTRDSLLSSDGDQVQDVYDARVGGGLAAQHRVAAVPCEAEACKSAPPSPPPPQPCGTVCFDGPTNQKPRKHKRHKKKAKHQKRHDHEKGGGR